MPASFSEPFNGAVTPKVLEGWGGNGLSFDDWKTTPIQWNTRTPTYTVYDRALPQNAISALLNDPSVSAADKSKIQAMAADGIVTLKDLAAIPNADRIVYGVLHH